MRSSSRLPITAYVAWCLCEGGFADSDTVRKACAYLADRVGRVNDPYVLALAANALVAGGGA